MKKIYCLSEQAINVLNQTDIKHEMKFILNINDDRTIEKHIQNNLPEGPLMNYNIKKLIRKYAPTLPMKKIYRELISEERVQQRREQLTTQNAKYNNENGEKNEKKVELLKQQVRTVAIVLIILKLFNLIQWQWLIVLCPVLFLLLSPVLFYLVAGIIYTIKSRKL